MSTAAKRIDVLNRELDMMTTSQLVMALKDVVVAMYGSELDPENEFTPDTCDDVAVVLDNWRLTPE